MQDAMTIEMRRRNNSGTVLRDLNPVLSPRAVSIIVGPVARSARRTGQTRKQFSERSDRPPNQLSLRLGRKEPFILRPFRVPILVSDPRHTPVNIRRPGFPEREQQFRAFFVVCHMPLNRRSAEVRRSVQRGIENSVSNSLAIGVQKSGTVPPLRETVGQRQEMDLTKVIGTHSDKIEIR